MLGSTEMDRTEARNLDEPGLEASAVSYEGNEGNEGKGTDSGSARTRSRNPTSGSHASHLSRHAQRDLQMPHCSSLDPIGEEWLQEGWPIHLPCGNSSSERE